MAGEPYRSAYLDPDFRVDPKTDFFCVRCQKSLDRNSKSIRWVHLIDDGMWVLHPEDEDKYESDAGDLLFHPVGPDCARKIGIEFTRDDY